MLKRILLPAMSVAVLFAVCAAVPAHAYDTHTKINFENHSSHSKVRFVWGKDFQPEGVDKEVAPNGKISIDEKAPAYPHGEKTYGYYLKIESPDGEPICIAEYKVTNTYDIMPIPSPFITDCKAKIITGHANCMVDKPAIAFTHLVCTSKVIYVDGLEK